MSTTFAHPSRILLLDRDPDLGNQGRVDDQQNIVTTDSGKEKVFSRKIPRRVIQISFKSVTKQEHADLQEFYENVLCESFETFVLTVVPVIADAWKVGYTQNGVPIQCGEPLVECSNDPLECGRYYRTMDSITLTPGRLQKGSFRATDGLRNGTDVSMIIIQELPVCS